MTNRDSFTCFAICFSTHILTRRMTDTGNPYTIGTGFSTHILTRKMTVLVYIYNSYYVFQLTSSQGGWLYLEVVSFPYAFFNSHPHKEDDWFCKLFILCCAFSTHILTRRMTATKGCDSENGVFSTHILTRRMTVYEQYAHTLRDFQLTSSQGGWRQDRHYQHD